MIEIRLTQQEVLEHIKTNMVEQEVSDFIMELTSGLSKDFTLSLIERLKRRDRNEWYGK